jgi:hypothetical protein
MYSGYAEPAPNSAPPDGAGDERGLVIWIILGCLCLPLILSFYILYILIICPPKWVYNSLRERRQRVEEKDQERKEKFPVSHLQNGLSELARMGFNDRGVNAVLLEQYDYEMEKVLDRLSDPSSKAHSKNIFGGVKVHSFDEDNLEALWDAARKAAAHRPPVHCPHYKAPAGLAYHAARLRVGVHSRLQPIVLGVPGFVQGVPRTAFRTEEGALPAGLSIDEVTGDIHGTPTEPASACRVTVTAFNGSGECVATVEISVAAAEMSVTENGGRNCDRAELSAKLQAAAASNNQHLELQNDVELQSERAAARKAAYRTPYQGKNYKAPAGLAYDAPQGARLVVGVQSKLQPDVSRFVLGVPRTAYRANGRLPAGLSIDVSTGDIHGTPTEPVSACRVTVTAFNGSGECSTTVDITVTAERAPEGLAYVTQDTSDLIVNVQT